MSDRFLGTWRLVSFVARGADGRETHPFGPSPIGYLMYDRGGRMSVHLSRPGGLPADESPGYFGYFGTYTVNESADTVTHHVEGVSEPAFASTDQRRYVTWHENRLVLSTASGQATGADVTYVATWERLP